VNRVNHPSSRDRALMVIEGLSDEWCRIQVLAKEAGLTVRSMSTFLSYAKKDGRVENRVLRGKYGSRVCEWRELP